MFKKPLAISIGVVALLLSFSLGTIAATKYNFTFNGKKQAMDIQMINDKPYVPLASVVKSFDGKVTYNALTKTYKVTSNMTNEQTIIATSTLGQIKQNDFYNKMKVSAGKQILGEMIVTQILESKYNVTEKEVTDELNIIKGQYGSNFENALKQSNMTEQSLKENIRLQLLQNKAKYDVTVSDKEIADYYAMASKELNARHILVPDETTANQVIAELKKGATFATVAKKYSADPGSANNGGELGWFTVGMMVKEFNDAAYALPVKTISKPVKTQFGYHIIEVTDKRNVKDYGTLQQNKENIKATIVKEKGSLGIKIQQLMKEAKVDITDPDLKPAVEAYLNTATQ